MDATTDLRNGVLELETAIDTDEVMRRAWFLADFGENCCLAAILHALGLSGTCPAVTMSGRSWSCHALRGSRRVEGRGRLKRTREHHVASPVQMKTLLNYWRGKFFPVDLLNGSHQ